MTDTASLNRIVARVLWIPVTGTIVQQTVAAGILAAIERIAKHRGLDHGVICAYINGGYHIGVVPTIETMFSAEEDFAQEYKCLMEHIMTFGNGSEGGSNQPKSNDFGLKKSLGRAQEQSAETVAIEYCDKKLEGEKPSTRARDAHILGDGIATIAEIGAGRIRGKIGNKAIEISIDYSKSSSETREALLGLLKAICGEVRVHAISQGGWIVHAEDLLVLLRRNLYGGAAGTLETK